jgi:tetratricopeptide (TPR) repeat protein
MAGGVARLLVRYQGVLVGRYSVFFPAPLGRLAMRWLGVQNGIATHYLAGAHEFANKGQYDNAIKACKASIVVRPDNMPAYETLAQILTHLGRYEEALDSCAAALEASPDSAAISASLRQILPALARTKRPDKVIATLDRCLAASPARVEVLMLLVDLLSQSRRYRELVHACQRVLKTDPEFFPAAEIIRNVLKDPDAKHVVAELGAAPQSGLSEEYEWLVASNVTDALIEVTSRFYNEIGINPHAAPLVQGLDRFRRKLSGRQAERAPHRVQSTLISFEAAWKQFRAGQTHKALRGFETIFHDVTARQRALHNHFLKEAVVRSGEILGRHYDCLGDVESAIGIYREILSVDQDAVVARRLMLLLSRHGRLREAADLAESAIVSRPNLFRHFPPTSHIASLKAEISLKPESA